MTLWLSSELSLDLESKFEPSVAINKAKKQVSTKYVMKQARKKDRKQLS